MIFQGKPKGRLMLLVFFLAVMVLSVDCLLCYINTTFLLHCSAIDLFLVGDTTEAGD